MINGKNSFKMCKTSYGDKTWCENYENKCQAATLHIFSIKELKIKKESHNDWFDYKFYSSLS